MTLTNSHRFNPNHTVHINSDAVPAWILQLANGLLRSGHQVYLVGGAVRDLIWGLNPKDWDLATDAPPETVESIFPGSIPTGKKFGTVTVIGSGGAVEITTLREDLGYNDGRHPTEIRYCGDIVKDLERRDFTVNAMAIDLANMELIDPLNGRDDCHRRLLKAVGDPAVRFQEDGLRMFRFYRFLATYPLRPERKTARAVAPVFAQKVSVERIRDEFSKTVIGARVGDGLIGLERSGLLTFILPEIEPVLQFTHGRPISLWMHILKTTEAIAPTLELRLAAFFHDIAKPQTISRTASGIHFLGHDERSAEIAGIILKRLRYPNKIIEKVDRLIRWHMFNIPPEAGNAAFRRFIAKVGAENVPDLLELRRADIVASGRMNRETWEYWSAFTAEMNLRLNDVQSVSTPLAINGNDIRNCFHLPPGPIIGEILDYLGGLILDSPELNQRDILLNAAEEYFKSKKQ